MTDIPFPASVVAELVDEQVRISSLRALQNSVAALRLAGTNLFTGDAGVIGPDRPPEKFKEEVHWMRSNLAGQVGINRASAFLEQDKIPENKARVREIATIGRQIAGLQDAGEAEAARELFSTTFMNRVQALDASLFARYVQMREKTRAPSKAATWSFNVPGNFSSELRPWQFFSRLAWGIPSRPR